MPTGTGKRRRQRLKAASRQWSCSELVAGHTDLMSTKTEKESDDELDKQIQDRFSLCVFCSMTGPLTYLN